MDLRPECAVPVCEAKRVETANARSEIDFCSYCSRLRACPAPPEASAALRRSKKVANAYRSAVSFSAGDFISPVCQSTPWLTFPSVDHAAWTDWSGGYRV